METKSIISRRDESMRSNAVSLGLQAQLWAAIETRDADYDGLFYYGVRTTRIFCRPSCRSRQPKRENVLFFALPEAARAAGFRACLRCRPEEVNLRDPQAELVQSVCHLIDTHVDGSRTLTALSEQVKLSQSHLQRLFKKLMGITPREYADAWRTDRFKREIKSGRKVTDAMYEVGYSSSSRLYEKAASQLGMTPATYRKGGPGVTIRFTTTESALGILLVAATDKGVCSVRLGNKSKVLETELRAEFPRADIQPDETGLQNQVQVLLDYLEGKRPHPDLPLDIQGTAFQKRVWEELRRIPQGQTASYSEIASRIGRPSAARAVASACAANPVAVVTPCHRVVRRDGNRSGYRWGRERKAKLQALEMKRFLAKSDESTRVQQKRIA
jgi:AraC family transcriptional regulator of adaptative response/methylated-DNA-[protein]-cysteine methyltransferase